MILKFDKQIYSKEAVIKAAYHFADKSYIHIQQNKDEYLINISSKNDEFNENIYKEFKNEVLTQSIHYMVFNETKTIRNIIMGRALSSTALISEMVDDKLEIENHDIDNIMKDWFENDN